MKSKGCLILGIISVFSGYVLGIAATIRDMLDGDSAAEIFVTTKILFPSLSFIGAILTAGVTITVAMAGLSAAGIALVLPLGAGASYYWGVFSASSFAAFGIKGIGRILLPLPIIAFTFLLTAVISGDGIKASFFTLQRLGVISAPRSQYAEIEDFSLQEYLKSTLVAILISCILSLYGYFIKGYVFR